MKAAAGALLLVLLVLSGGCSSEPRGSTPPAELPAAATAAPRTPDPGAMTSRPPSKPVRVVVPDLVGDELPDAFATLRRLDLDVAFSGPSSTCGTYGLVQAQRPGAGFKVRGRGLVFLTVEAATDDCALTATQRDVANAFIAFARHDGELSTRDRVRIFIGHQPAGVLLGAARADPDSWSGCPASGSYAGKSCPFLATAALAAGSSRPSLGPLPPTHPCLSASALLPPAVERLDSVTLALAGDCLSYQAVRIFFDRRDRVVAVDVETAEP